jgi:hypothetical protein
VRELAILDEITSMCFAFARMPETAMSTGPNTFDTLMISNPFFAGLVVLASP